MKQIFYTLWLVVTVALSGITLLMLSASISWASLAVLAIVIFYAFCFFRLIRACYSKDVFADETNKWYWLNWILASIAVLLIKIGLTVMITGDYLSRSGRGRWISMSSLLNWMGDLLAPWLPGLFLLIIGTFLFVICVKNIIRFSSKSLF